jgi:hypothetical protein
VSQITKFLSAAALVCAIAMMAVAPAASAFGSSMGVRPAKAVPITLYGSVAAPRGWGFATTSITQPGPPIAVDQGDVITFTLFAADSQAHNLVIDINSNNVQDPSEPHSANFMSPTTAVTFVYTADTAGNLQYICGLHGGTVMGGPLTVRSTAPPPPPPSDNTLLIVGGVVGIVAIVGVAAAMMMRKKKPRGPPQP